MRYLAVFCLLSTSAHVVFGHDSETDPGLLSESFVVPSTCSKFSKCSAVIERDLESERLNTRPNVAALPRVSLPVDNPTKSFWLDTPNANPLAQVGSTGELSTDGDVCIIGSGITGVSAAWHLSKMLNEEEGEGGTKVVILEAREFCSGATGRNGGHLTRNVFSSFLSRQAAHNTTEAVKSYLLEEYTSEALVRFIAERKLEDAVDLVEGGHIEIFRTEDDEIAARRDYQAARAAGVFASGDMGVKWIGKEELSEAYGVDPKLNYTAVSFVGHNLWPCKLVTHLYEDTQSPSSGVDVVLHTKTPVTSISRRQFYGGETEGDDTTSPSDQIPLSTTMKEDAERRRWTLHTPRGNIGCTYVVHATNGYAAHLLPLLTGVEHSPVALAGIGRLPPGRESEEEGSPAPPHRHPAPLARPPLPRGVYGIVPTRGQVGAVRASVDSSDLPWLNSWDGGGGGWEYWFPRYQDTASRLEAADIHVASNARSNISISSGSKNPLIILGGGRQFSGGTLEAGITDDSVTNPLVSKALKAFLPGLFPSQFAPVPSRDDVEADPWEMEWTGIMAFTKTGEPFVGPVVHLANTISVSESDSENVEDMEQSKNQFEGQYIAAGYSGHGMPRAYACAEAVAGMIKAKIRGEQWIAPDWLPESYLTWATRP